MKIDISLRAALFVTIIVAICTADAWVPAWHQVLSPSLQITQGCIVTRDIRF